MTTTITELEQVTDEELVPYEDNDDPNLRAHIINPPNNIHIWKPGMTSKDIVDVARINQIEIVALCGYRFVPKHNPDKYDACQACIRIASEMMRGSGE